MPTVLREGGYTFHIYTNDHPPAHVHVKRDNAEARITLDPIEVKNNWGFNNRQIKRIVEIVQENQQFLLEAWDSIHSSR